MTLTALANYWAQLERERGLPPGYLSRTRQIESGGNPNAVSPTGPVGPFQFTKGTARAVGLPLAARTDEYASARAAADLAAQNKSILTRALGREPQGWELYMGHQQGGGGAASLLTNPGEKAGALVPAQNISVNAGDPNKPAASILAKFQQKYMGVRPGDELMGQNRGVPTPPPRPVDVAAGPTPLPTALPAPTLPIREGGGLLGMARRFANGTPSATALAPAMTPTAEALAAAPAAPKPVSELTGFMSSPEMQASLKGASMLATAMQGAPVAAAPAPITVADDANIPDIATLLAKLKKKGQL